MGLLHDLGLYNKYSVGMYGFVYSQYLTILRRGPTINRVHIMKEESKEMYIFVALIFV